MGCAGCAQAYPNIFKKKKKWLCILIYSHGTLLSLKFGLLCCAVSVDRF